MMDLFLPTLYISTSPNQICVKVTIYLKSLMSEILDINLTYCNNGWKDLQSSNSQRQFKKKEVRKNLDFWLKVISETTLGLVVPLAESVKVILCLTGIKVSLWALTCTFSQCNFIHIGQALTFNDFLTRHALAESLLWINAEETSGGNSIIPLRSYLPFAFL